MHIYIYSDLQFTFIFSDLVLHAYIQNYNSIYSHLHLYIHNCIYIL